MSVGSQLSPAHTVEKKFLTSRKRTRHTCPWKRGQKEIRRLESKQRNKQSAGQHHEAGGCGERCRRERERAHRQAGRGRDGGGLGVVKGPGDEKFRSGFLQKSSGDLRLP